MSIGEEVNREPLVLIRGRDFEWALQNQDNHGNPLDYPAGDLYIEFDDGVPTQWHFTIDGSSASIKVESEVADLVKPSTRYQLVFLPTGESAGGQALLLGSVAVER